MVLVPTTGVPRNAWYESESFLAWQCRDIIYTVPDTPEKQKPDQGVYPRIGYSERQHRIYLDLSRTH